MDKLTENYPVVVTQNLVWSDMDAYQHVNNAVCFRHLEDARIAYFARVEIKDHMAETGIGRVLRLH